MSKSEMLCEVTVQLPTIDAKSDIESVVKILKTHLRYGKIDDRLECVKQIQAIMYTVKSDPERSDVYEKALVNTKIFDVLLGLIESTDNTGIIESLIDDDDTRELNRQIVLCMMNVTNWYSSIGEAIAEHGGISLLTNICKCPRFLVRLDEKKVYSFIELVVGTLHNIARLSSVPQYFGDSKTAEAMVPLFHANNERLRIYATLAAAQTCEDITMLANAEGVISSLLHYLDEASKNEQYCYGGAKLIELLDGIDKLACADTNKKKILDVNALPIFRKILNIDSPKEQALTARILWNLTFDNDVVKHVKSNKDLLDKLQNLSKSSNKAIRRNVQGLFYNIERRGKKDVASLDHKSEIQQKDQHVFISYSWNEKDIVLKVNEFLQGEKIPIWIDKEQMRGSTLQAMAEAVENASIVLMCMSESYQHSPNCRLEAEYVYQCKKTFIPLMVQKHYKPDGWLGILLGAKLYIDLSGRFPFETKVNELIREMQANTIFGKEAEIPSQERSPKKRSTDFDVKQWLSLNKLEGCSQYFGKVDGEGLLQLKKMRNDVPEFYFKTLSNKLNLSLGDMLNLTAALETL